MAMIQCGECGREISDKAQACVHCGCPITHAHMDSTPVERVSLRARVKETSFGALVALNGGVIQAIQDSLAPRELVLFALVTNANFYANFGSLAVDPFKIKDKVGGVVVITTARAIWGSGNMGNYTIRQIPIDTISVDSKTDIFVGGKIRIMGLTDMIVVDANRKQIQEMTAAIYSAKDR